MPKPVLVTALLAVFATAPTFPVKAVSFCPAAIRSIDASAAKTLKQGSPGMIVAIGHKDRPLLIKGYGLANLEHNAPVVQATVFKLASVTKQFTAAAVLQLEEEGKLNLGDKLSNYVPELPQSDKVTLYQLLVQTSGIPDYAEDPVGLKTKAVARTGDEMLAWIGRLKPRLLFEPGSRWAYSNSNYAILGIVLERVEGQSLSTIFNNRLFKRAGLTHTAFDDPGDVVSNRAEGYRLTKSSLPRFRKAESINYTIPGAAGGLRTTGLDLIKWENALFGGRILARKSLRKLLTPGLLSDGRSTKLGMPIEWQKGLNADYGMGVFITPTTKGTRIWHGGDIDGFSTWVSHYPDRSLTIALMINSESADLDKDGIEQAVFDGLQC